MRPAAVSPKAGGSFFVFWLPLLLHTVQRAGGTPMRTRQQSTKGWVIFAAFCAVLFCMTVLRACAAKTAPEDCSLERVRPTQAVCFPLGTNGWRVSDAYGWRTDPLTGEETFHRGTDLACAEGTQVLAVMDGVVSPPEPQRRAGDALRPPPIPLRPGRGGGAGGPAAGHSRGDRPLHRSTPPFRAS